MNAEMHTLSARRCVVVGAGGFIGTHLCHALIARGARVVGYGRPARYALDQRIDWISAQTSSSNDLMRVLRDGDIVFHLIGSANPGASNLAPLREMAVDVPAGLEVLEACRTVSVQKLIFLSSGGAVYRPGLPTPIAEDAPTDPISAYGIGKLVIEKYCSLYTLLYGLDAVVLRLSNPFGPLQSPDKGQGFIAKLIRRILENEPIQIWGDGSAVRDFLFIDDAIEAIILAAIMPEPVKLLNIGSGVGRSLREVVDSASTIIGRPAKVEYETARSSDTPINVLDITRARQQLGWSPTTRWEDGLHQTAAWLSTLPR